MTFTTYNLTCRPERRSPLEIAFHDTGGDGEPVLLLAGLGGGDRGWEPFIAAMPAAFRFIALDPGADGELNEAEGAGLLRFFIREKNLADVTLVAHSLAAAAAVEALDDAATRLRCRRLVLIAPAGLTRERPELSIRLSGPGDANPLNRRVDAELKSYLLLAQLYADPGRISDDAVIDLAATLCRRPDAAERLAAAAARLHRPDQTDFIRILESIRMPALIVWGGADPVLPPATADRFAKHLAGSRTAIIPNCGHLPQQELPDETAARVKTFLDADAARPAIMAAEPAAAPAGRKKRKIQLRKLVDSWTLSNALFILFLKSLQLLRALGMKARENGWRKATGIFMRNEYSKFILTSFRLRYYRGRVPADYRQARNELIERLAAFLHNQPSFHWSAEPGFFCLGRRKTFFCDIVEAHYTIDGRMERLEPHFDDERGNFDILTREQIDAALAAVIANFNRLSKTSGRLRLNLMHKRMRRWADRVPGLKYAARAALKLLVERLMTATYLHFECLPPGPEEALQMRLRTPNLKKYRHPGWGLLNIFCRFTADLAEVDLWVQFHHVPVDGAPMQELLERLKNEWGSIGAISYPAAASRAARPEIFHCGDRLFRARFYVRFDRLLATRSFLNARYREATDGPITIAGMILWGLSRHAFFNSRKMLFPVDSSKIGDPTGERELSLAFIRPGKFDTPEAPLTGFLAFQREFNRMIRDIRAGESESTEFLELCSMAHPLIYHLADWVAPHALREIVGTVGVSIIKDAEMFISPLSDFQTAGFMAIGAMTTPTADGTRTGAVSVCGSRVQVRHYIEAVSDLAERYPEFLGIADPIATAK